MKVTTLRHSGGIVAVSNHDDWEVACISEDSGWFCACDARIDNLAELRRQLATVGAKLAGDASSARVLLEAYRVFGERAWVIAEGDFACAIWRSDARFVVLARDVIGARPLYLAAGTDGICFATELRAIVALRGAPLSIDAEQAVRRLSHLVYGMTSLDKTIFDGIGRVAPGCMVTWCDGRSSVKRYWDPRQIQTVRGSDIEGAAIELHDRIVRATLARSSTAGRLGCHFSGGIDCSSIAAIIQRHHGNDRLAPVFYAWTPRSAVSESASELARIDALSDMHGIRPVFVDPEEYYSALDSGDSALKSLLYPNETMVFENLIQRHAANNGVTSMISGWGGDEAASHYGTGLAPELFLSGRWFSCLNVLARGGSFARPTNWRQAARRARTEIVGALVQRLRNSAPACIASNRLSQEFPAIPVMEPRAALSVREAQMSAYYSGHLSVRIESWACHGKRHGLTYCYPLLDRGVLELIYSLPGHYFRVGGVGRYLFRKAMARYWPENMIFRVPKDETGLAEFLMAGKSNIEMLVEFGVGNRAMAACLNHEVGSELLDQSTLRNLIRALGDSGDWLLLERADQMIEIAQWIQKFNASTFGDL